MDSFVTGIYDSIDNLIFSGYKSSAHPKGVEGGGGGDKNRG